jgi:hypothetical protein
MNKKTIFSIIGFSMLAIGFLGLALSLVGLGLWPTNYIDRWNPLIGFVFKLILIVGGVVVMAITRINWKSEQEME